jgi:hypothetical protein
MTNMSELPAELLHAVAQRSGRVALVLGAGCSLEPPTGLRLARDYSLDAHRQLIQDGVLEESECSDPEDLSALASCVVEKTGGQSALVRCLPAERFRMARPNDGYLIAAALLREQAVDAILTLNFDLAMSNALTLLSATEVSVIPGPQASGRIGSRTVIYLHRSVEELDLEKWILTSEALENDWREGWQEVVARRTMACPVVVFAGLGSQASVLTETVTRIRQGLETGEHHVFVVDPADHTPFAGALALEPGAHIQMGWGTFMHRLAARVVSEMQALMIDAARRLCGQHGWLEEVDGISGVVARFHTLGMTDLGSVRARWLLAEDDYVPDDVRRMLIADLLLAIGLVESMTSLSARFGRDGVVKFVDASGQLVAAIHLASGGGTMRWSALEPRMRGEIDRRGSGSLRTRVLVGGVTGSSLSGQGPPEDYLSTVEPGDIIDGPARLEFLSVDDLRSDPTKASELVA